MTIYLILISSMLLSALGVVGLWCFRNSSSSPWVIIGLLCILFLLPLGVYVPGFTFSVTEHASDGIVTGFSWSQFIALLWAGGVMLGSVKILLDVRAYHLWACKASPAHDAEMLLKEVCDKAEVKPPLLLTSPTLSSPVLGGLWRPTIFLPEHYSEWDTETLKVVLWHEVGHLVRKDLWKQFFAQITYVLYWFNPFLKRLKGALSYQCELACDGWVIQSGVCRKVYLNALCDVAQHVNKNDKFPYSLSMAEPATLATRIKTLISNPTKKRPIAVMVFLFSLMVLGISIVSTKTTSDAYPQEELSLRLSATPFPMD